MIAIPAGIIIFMAMLFGWFLMADNGADKLKYGCGCLILGLIVLAVIIFGLFLSLS